MLTLKVVFYDFIDIIINKRNGGRLSLYNLTTFVGETIPNNNQMSKLMTKKKIKEKLNRKNLQEMWI